jgi:hypothetical protein
MTDYAGRLYWHDRETHLEPYTDALIVRDVGTEINAVRADLADTAALVNSIIDDLQALGLVA